MFPQSIFTGPIKVERKAQMSGCYNFKSLIFTFAWK